MRRSALAPPQPSGGNLWDLVVSAPAGLGLGSAKSPFTTYFILPSGVYISDKELRGLMLEFDPENTGELDFQRFIELMLRTYVTEDAEDEYRRAFNFTNSYTRK